MLFRVFLVIFGLGLWPHWAIAKQLEPLSRAEVLDTFKSHFSEITKYSADDFFKDRWKKEGDKSDPKFLNCLGWLNFLTKNYRVAREKGRFAEMEKIMTGGDGRPSFVDIINRCGPCISHTKKVADWSYLSQGWCRFRDVEKFKFQEIYNQLGDFFTSYASYRKTKNGVFNDMLKFQPIDSDFDGVRIPPSGSTSLIAVDGKLYAYAYLAKLAYWDRRKGEVPHFIFQFNGLDTIPDEFAEKYRRIQDPGMPNRTPLQVSWLTDVDGFIYFDLEGNFTYRTHGYFGWKEGALPLESSADRVLMGAVWNVHDKFLPKLVKEATK